MTRKECLDAAAGCVLKDRQNQYGKPEDCFGMIARMWGAYLGVCVSAHDVAAMMALLKIARFRHNPFHEDNAVDLAGYAACGAECSAGRQDERKNASIVSGSGPKEGEERKDEAEEAPIFHPGDRVEVHSLTDRDVWELATVESSSYVEGAGGWLYTVHYADGWPRMVSSGRVRPAPKAEGCEELVFDEARMRESMPGIVPQDGQSDFDAPQTPQELYRRIIDANPATFGDRFREPTKMVPHKPTGEELAEMAEEEPHG